MSGAPMWDPPRGPVFRIIDGMDLDGGGYSLVMPFKVVKSAGGRYEDDAFVAGYHCGLIDRTLSAIAHLGGNSYKVTVQAGVVGQLDLIAMRYGFIFSETEIEGCTEWREATFERDPGCSVDGD